MNKRTSEAGRQLRDYPLSLRESARAVFGNAYVSAEKRGVMETVDMDAAPRRT